MLRPTGARVALVLALLGGCGEDVPLPVVQAVVPAAGYSDRDLRLTIVGTGFIPSYRIDTQSGSRIGQDSGFTGHVGMPGVSAGLSGFGWRDVTLLSATLQHGLPPGAYPVVVTDPRGRAAVLPNGFTSLGPDLTAPRLTFQGPSQDALVAPGVTLSASLSADDQAPGRLIEIYWELRGPDGAPSARGDCPVAPGDNTTSCQFTVTVPLQLHQDDIVQLRAVAIDDAFVANQTASSLFFKLRARPTISEVSPAYGGIAGGTDVLIRGSGFLPGSQAFFGPTMLIPNGGLVLDERTISGRTPPLGEGPAVVMVRTAVGDATDVTGFEYRSPPQINGFDPIEGDPLGGVAFRVWGSGFSASTRIYFGNVLGQAVPLQQARRTSDREIRGITPPGAGRASVWALDPDLGWSRAPDAFEWGP